MYNINRLKNRNIRMARKYRYQQLVDQIVQDYCTQLAPGDLLPGLPELCRKYNTSEITVKKTMSLLAEHGVVRRIPGKGTMLLELPERSGSQPIFIPSRTLRILTLENWSFSDYLDDQAVAYSKMNPEMQFKICRVPMKNYAAEAARGEYDLIAANEWVLGGETVAPETLRPLEEFPGLSFNPAACFPEVLKLCRRDGATYLLPLGFSPLFTVCNLERPEISRIDWRRGMELEEFAAVMESLKNPNLKYPFLGLVMMPGIWGHFIHACGGSIGEFGQPGAQRGLNLLYNMLHERHICPCITDYSMLWNLFDTGRFAATWGKYGRLKNTALKRVGVAPLPHGKVPNGSIFLEGLMIGRASRYPAEIKDFLNFLLTADAQVEICAATDGLSVQKRVAEFYLERLKKQVEGAENLLSGLEYMRLVPESRKQERVIRAVNIPLQMLIMGIYNPEEFAVEAAKNIKE